MNDLIRLIELAKKYDYSIEFNSNSRRLIKDSNLVSGYIDYGNRKILINKIKHPRMVLYHLCHELGHMISRNSIVYRCWSEKYSSELIAHYFGWKIIRQYHINITRHSWKKYYKY